MANEERKQIIDSLERIDEKLEALDKMLTVTAMGASAMANGEYIDGIISCVRHNLQGIRADLDEITGTAIIAQAIA